MPKEYSYYSDYVKSRPELTTLPFGWRDEVESVLGQKFIHEPSQEETVRAAQYLSGWIKNSVDRVLCLVGLKMGGNLALASLAGMVERADSSNGSYFNLDVGFVGQPLVQIEKLRTMVPGAHEMIENPFRHTNFVAGDGTGDVRILDSRFLRFLRRSGLDEMPQLRQIAAGQMWLVGPRGYTNKEIEGLNLLIKMKDDPAIAFGREVKTLLSGYPAAIQAHLPKPAIFGPLSAFRSKETHWAVRMFLDMQYLSVASPAIDLFLMIKTFQRRQVKGIGAR